MTRQHIDAPSQSGSEHSTRQRRRRLGIAAVAAGCAGLGLACAAVEVAYTIKFAPWLIDNGDGYLTPADIWGPLQAARWVANGAVLFMYEAAGARYDYGPLWPVVLAPAVAVGDHLGLVDNSRHVVPRPTMAIPMIVAAVTVSVTALAAATWRVTRPSGLAARARTVAAVVGPAMLAAGSWFHGEDMLVAAFVLFAAANPALAGFWTAAALLTKQTMLAYAPALLAACKPGRRGQFIVIAAAVPAAVMLAVFAATPTSMVEALTGAPTCSDCFTPALWTSLVWDDAADITATYGRVSWIAAGAAIAWLWRHRCRDVQGLLAVLTMIALTRALVFEAGVYAYYWVPAMLFTLVWSTRAGRRLWPALLGFAGLVVWHQTHRSVPLAVWWAVTAAAAAVVWHPVLRSIGKPQPRRSVPAGGEASSQRCQP